MSDEKNPFGHLLAKTPVESVVQPETQVKESTNPLTSLFAPPAPVEPRPTTPTGDPINSSYELAAVDTTNLTPTTQPKTQLASKVEARIQQLVLDSGKKVRDLCDEVDKLMTDDVQLVGPPLITIRAYVQSLMVTLKMHPEFETILLDKDVRNVMRFVRSTREEAMSLRDVKTEKKAVRGVKKERTTKAASDMSDAFAEVFGSMGLLKKP